jgi:adenylate cyclase
MVEKKIKKLSRTAFFAVSAAVIYFIFTLLFHNLPSLDEYKFSWGDWLNTVFEKRPPNKDLVLISIDNEDLKAIGEWPWNRKKLAEVVTFLTKAGASVILFDIYFRKNNSGDEDFARAIKAHGKVVLAQPWDSVRNFPEEPLQIFRESKAYFGHVAMTQKKVFRFLPLYIMNPIVDRRKSLDENILCNSLSLTGVKLFLGIYDKPSEKHGSLFTDSVSFGELKVPVIYKTRRERVPHMIINFCGESGCFNKAEYAQEFAVRVILKPSEYGIVQKKELEEKVKGKIVLIYNRFDPNDMVLTPYSSYQKEDSGAHEMTPGGEVHANAIATLLDRRFISYSYTLDYTIPFIVLLICVLVFSSPIKWWIRIALFAGIIIMIPVLSIFLYSQNRLIISIVPPIASSVVMFLAMIYYERKQFVTLFGDFVSHRLKDQVLMDDSKGAVGTREVEATIVFADIRGFSTFSEKLSPGELTSKMTEYHTEMNRIFERNRGQILDYLGDAEMIGFGILGEDRYHPLRAIKSGLEMQIEIAKIRERWNLPGGQQFEVGVGICTGMVAEGIVGSEGVKKQLISMGDTTNTAARIQALSKDLDSLVTISESTYVKVKDDVIADALKEMPLKGKTQKVMLYRIRGITEEALKRL